MSGNFKIVVVVIFIVFISTLVYLFMKSNNEEVKLENLPEQGLGTQYLTATFETNYGDFKIEFLWNEATKTSLNFVNLAKNGFYDGTRFHRVIKDFMIQGGDPNSKDVTKKNLWGTGGPGYMFDDEKNNVALVQGIVAMANSGPNTNGSQFFIVTAESTPWLNGKHTAFAKIVNGIDVVMKIQEVSTEEADRPIQDVVINKITLE